MGRYRTVTHGNEGNPVAEAARSIRIHLMLAFGFGAAVNLLFLASPLYMMQLYGRVLNSRSIETLVSISIALAFALILMGAADAARGRLLARAAGRLSERLLAPAARQALVAGCGQAPANFADVEALRKFIAGGAVATIMDTPFTLFFLLVLFLIHPMLGLVASFGGIAILLVIGTARLGQVRRELRIAEQERFASALGGSLGSDRGEIRALGLAPGLAARLASSQGRADRMQLASGDINASVGATARTIRLAAHSAALATGAVLAIQDELAPSAMLAAAILAGRALGPVEALPTALRSGRLAREAAKRLESRTGDAGVAERARSGPDRPATLEVRRLVVVPQGAARAALRSVSFRIEAGETVSIAGPSGAGKSTLLRCIAGADPVRSGEIRFAGIEIGERDGGTAPGVGWLPQDAPVFPGTVRENIARFGTVAEEEVRAAAERAGALTAIEWLPRGFDTELGSSAVPASLRQSIALARALLPQPRLLLLDQPTAHLDAAGEVAVLNAIQALKAAGVTIVLVSHKPVLSTLADRIMLMRDGSIEVFEERDTVLNAMRRKSLRTVANAKAEAEASS